MTRSTTAPALVLTSMLCLLSAPVWGQGTAATILGDVRDETGAVLPGVTVTAINVATGSSRATTTQETGRYRIPTLQVGTYDVTAELAGFKTTTRTGITLAIGQEAVVALALQLGAIAENVVVTGEAQLVDSSSGVIGGLIDTKAIQDLPLNGRSFIELATLRTGTSFAEYGAQSESQGFGKKISISGSRFTSNVFLLDGTVMNDSFNSAGSAAGGTVTGVETVREFKVVTNAYSAEYGQHTGGVVNAVTKSGTNALHGSVYEFHRNDALDAPNFFDVEQPDFVRNQFGVAAGGPIAKNRTFFFANYEGLRESLGVTELLLVPSVDARRGYLRNRQTGQLEFVGIHPEIAALVNKVWPQPNSTDFGDGRAEFTRALSAPTTQNFLSTRLDHRFSDNDTVFGRYTIDDAERVSPESINVEARLASRNQFMTFEYGRVMSSSLINTFNVGFTRTNTGKFGSPLDGFDRVTFTDSEYGHGVMNVGGLTSSGSGNLDPRVFILNNYQVKNDLTYLRGNHSLKAGFSFAYYKHDDTSPRQPAGAFTFDNIGDFLRGSAREALISLAENFERHVRQKMIGLYFQDDWRLGDSFTLNAGVRWETYSRPTEIEGNNPVGIGGDLFFDTSITPADIVLSDSVFQENPSLTNFAPRVGFAWDPFGDGKTSVRGGAGIFHEPLLYWTYRMALWHTAPIFVEGRLVRDFAPIDFPNAYFTQRALFVGNPRYESIDPSPAQPYVGKFSVEVQRSLSDTTALKVGYSGTRGVNLGRSNEINGRRHTVLEDGTLFFVAGAPVNNPNFGRSRHRTFDGVSDYHSLRVEFDKRFGAGLQVQSGYTFSKNMDDGAAITGSTDFTNENGPSRHFTVRDYALSPLDVRHHFTLSVLYELPDFGEGTAAVLAGGWRLNALLRLTGGSPFSVETGFDRQRSIQGTQYPNLADGASNNPIDPGNFEQYYDPSAFALQPAGYLGNLGRNTLRSPGVATMDFSLAKMFDLQRVSDDFKIEFRAEFFNLLNRANFALPVRTVFLSATSGPRADAGRITSTITTARQIQFGLKMLF